MQIDTGASCNVLPQKCVSSGTNIIQSDFLLYLEDVQQVYHAYMSSAHAQLQEQQTVQRMAITHL